MMSTCASVIMVVSGTLSEDIIHKALGKNLTSDQLVRLSRIVILCAGALGLLVAMTSGKLIYYITSWMNAGVGSVLSAIVLLGLFYKKSSARGIAWSILIGTIFTIGWMITPLENIVSARFMSFAATILSGILLSHLCPDSKYETEMSESQAAG